MPRSTTPKSHPFVDFTRRRMTPEREICGARAATPSRDGAQVPHRRGESLPHPAARELHDLVEAGGGAEVQFVVQADRDARIVAEAPIGTAALVHVAPRGIDDGRVARHSLSLDETLSLNRDLD